MDIKSPSAVETIVEWDFRFLGSEKYNITLHPDKKDTCTAVENGYIITFRNDDGSIRELIDLSSRNLLFASSRTRTIAVVDPNDNPVSRRLKELAAANRSSIPTSQES